MRQLVRHSLWDHITKGLHAEQHTCQYLEGKVSGPWCGMLAASPLCS